MKSHKRILAFVLVLCMAFGVAAAGNAAYTDAPKIKYGTAVGVMTGLGALNGKPDGGFDPAGLVTRAEAAKLVTYAILGPVLAKQLPAFKSTFNDVPASHWASKYIEYLVSKGIVGGRGNGVFDPVGNVTAAEMAKMLLSAAGYGKNNEYSGANWANNVVIDAISNDIFKDSAQKDYKKAATREEAALYVFNAIMSIVKVSYSSGYNSYTPVIDAEKNGITIAEATYGMQEPITGIITNNAATGYKGTALASITFHDSGPDEGKIALIKDSPILYKYTTDLKQIGTVVKVYYKDADTVYYVDTLSKTVTSLLGATASSSSYKLLFGTAEASAYTVNASTNYKNVTVNTYLGPTPTAFNSVDKYPKGTYAVFGGEVVSYVPFTSSYIEYIEAMDKAPGAETITLSSGTVVQNNAGTDYADEYQGMAVGDTVCVTPAGRLFIIEKTATVQGKISKYDAVNTKYTLDGKIYSKSSAIDLTGIGFQKLKSTDYEATDFTLYLDPNGLAYGLKATAPVSNIIYAVAKAYPYGSTYGISDWRVQAVDSSGKQVIYNAGSGAGSAGETNPTIVTRAGFYKVDVDTNGKAKFSAVAPTDLVHSSVADTVVKTDIKNGSAGGNTYYYADNVQFIFISGMESSLKIVKVTGVTDAADNILRDITAADGTQHLNAMMYFEKSQNINKSVTTVIVPAAYVRSINSDAPLLYLPDTQNYNSEKPVFSSADGYGYRVYIDGVPTTVTATNSDMTGLAGCFISYSVDSEGIYTFESGIADNDTTINYDVSLDLNGVFNSYIDGRLTDNAVVVDLVTNPLSGDPKVDSVVKMEASTETVTYTISYAAEAATGRITQIYITAMNAL